MKKDKRLLPETWHNAKKHESMQMLPMTNKRANETLSITEVLTVSSEEVTFGKTRSLNYIQEFEHLVETYTDSYRGKPRNQSRQMKNRLW